MPGSDYNFDMPEDADRPEVLARHYTEEGLNEEAALHWLMAGKQAIQQDATEEAIGHFQNGLAVVSASPGTPELAKSELEMQISLGTVIMALKGPASPDVERIYARARVLCREIGETEHVFPALWGIWRFHLNRGELEQAGDVSDRLLYLAKKENTPPLLLEAHMAHGTSLLYLGDLQSSHEHFETGLAIYDANPDQSLADFYGGCDPGVYCLSYSGLTLWRLGYPDKALQRCREAVEHAGAREDAYNRVFAMNYAAVLHRYRREPDEVRRYAEAEIALANEHEYPIWVSLGTTLLGWARAEQGDLDAGVDLIREGLDGYLSTGASLAKPWLGLLAEACGKAGDAYRALSLVDEALEAVSDSHGRYWESELYCLKGELHRQDGNDQEAESSFDQAVAVAQDQHARSLEIRPTINVCNLLTEQDQNAKARQLLTDICDQFTEGFDAPDLRQAQALLDQLE